MRRPRFAGVACRSRPVPQILALRNCVSPADCRRRAGRSGTRRGFGVAELNPIRERSIASYSGGREGECGKGETHKGGRSRWLPASSRSRKAYYPIHQAQYRTFLYGTCIPPASPLLCPLVPPLSRIVHALSVTLPPDQDIQHRTALTRSTRRRRAATRPAQCPRARASNPGQSRTGADDLPPRGIAPLCTVVHKER